MQFVVLAAPDSWYLKDLVRAADGEFEITPMAFRELTASVGCEPSGRDTLIDRADAVIVRTMPPGSLEQVVFRMDVLGRLEVAGKVVVNPARAIEAAVDKYLASAKLSAAGLRTPRTIVCQTVDAAMTAFAALGGDVVLKPLFGAEGAESRGSTMRRWPSEPSAC